LQIFSGKKANGKKFENVATINMPRSLIPKKGAAIKIKYNANYEFGAEDFIIQIGGRFIYAFTAVD